MTTERWGGFVLVPPENREPIATEPGVTDCGCDDDHSLGPWEQPGTERLDMNALLGERLSYELCKAPDYLPSGLTVNRIHIRRSSTNRALVQVDLAYAAAGVAVQDWSDADLHVFWSALAPYPIGRTLHAAPLPVYGSNVIGGWMHPHKKVRVRGTEGVTSVFQAKAPVTARSARIPNALMWFEERIFWTIQGYYEVEELQSVAESLRHIGTSSHP
jgi:hypothetical protein